MPVEKSGGLALEVMKLNLQSQCVHPLLTLLSGRNRHYIILVTEKYNGRWMILIDIVHVRNEGPIVLNPVISK